MQRVHRLPSSFRRFRKVGGVLDFGLFDESDGADADVIEAVDQTLRYGCGFDGERLIELGGRPVFKRALLGDWYDPDNKTLLRRGEWTTVDGHKLIDPSLPSLGNAEPLSGAEVLPEPGEGGQLAYAFSRPPYPLNARPSEVQELFDSIIGFLLPRDLHHEILDWSNPMLVEVSDYFDTGSDGWGVHLYTIHTPELRRLSVIAGSATD